MGRLGSIVGLFCFPVLLSAVGATSTMLIIAVFPVIAIVALIVTPLRRDQAMGREQVKEITASHA